MTVAVIEGARCVTCRRCVAACASGAITVNGDSCVVDSRRCVACGACVVACRTDAITIEAFETAGMVRDR